MNELLALTRQHILTVIRIPVFVAAGDRDPMILPRYSYLLAGLIADCRLKIYPDAAHGFLFQHHEVFPADMSAHGVSQRMQQQPEGPVQVEAVPAAAGEGDPRGRLGRSDAPPFTGLDPQGLVGHSLGLAPKAARAR